MSYQTDLASLKEIKMEEGVFVKYVPGLTEAGYLDPRAKEELLIPRPETDENAAPPSLEDMRANMGWKNAKDISKNELDITNDVVDGSIPVRIYRKKSLSEKVPVLVFLHGGGFMGGTLDNVEHPCRGFADKGDWVVVSVDYSLAPERPYPNGLLDCYRVVKWLHENSDTLNVTRKIAIAGDSAGGNLSITTSLLDRMLGTNFISAQILIYPVVGSGTTLESPHWDITRWLIREDRELIEPYILGFGGMNQMVDQMYAQGVNPQTPLVSPLLSDRLGELPPTCLIVGEFDPLRMQGEALVEKLKAVSVPIDYYRYNGMTHAFMDKVGDFAQAEDLIDVTVTFAMPHLN